MRIIICSDGDANSSRYQTAEQTFTYRLAAQKKGQLPKNTTVTTLCLKDVTLPDVNDRFSTQALLTPLLMRLGIDPYSQQVEWKAELYKESGYTFIAFFVTGIGL